MYRVVAVFPLVALAAAVACSDMTAPQSSEIEPLTNTGQDMVCPDGIDGWIKINSSTGSENGDYGSFSWEGNTLAYSLNAGWTLEFCIKYATYRDYEEVSGTGEHETGTGQNISHISWRVIEAGDAGFQGCTPGFWRNHLNDWIGLNPDDTYALSDDFEGSYLDAITARGGGANAYARAATAAQLNIFHPDIDYAVEDLGEYSASQLDEWNNAGCPVDGSDNTTAGGRSGR
jgi:hypothetical protein